jgi:DNA-binding transcriptional ArsR family regulator
MSRGNRSHRSPRRRVQAPIFAALGDSTRLTLVARLSQGDICSISQLTEGTRLTRQAVTKHLRVLEHADIVRGVRHGRQNLFSFNPEPIQTAKNYLELVSEQWDQTLSRLRSFVEKQ